MSREKKPEDTSLAPEDKPNIFDLFVERPLVAVVLSLALILLGIRAAIDMPVLEFPEIESFWTV